MEKSKLNPGTAAVWAGELGEMIEKSHTVPVFNTVTFGYADIDEWYDVAKGNRDGHIYSRNTNPTVAVLEEKVRVLEHAEAATSFASGMGAISSTLFALLKPGDRLVSVKDTYGGTSRLFLEFLPKYGIEITLCDTEDHEEMEREIAKGCELVYLESPTNPTLKIIDLKRMATAASKTGAITIVDNTFGGFGGILSFELKGGYESVRTLLHNLQFVHLAASLGSVSTLAGPPRTTSHVELTEKQRAELGISESLIRYSVGIENAEDLLADLEQALDLL